MLGCTIPSASRSSSEPVRPNDALAVPLNVIELTSKLLVVLLAVVLFGAASAMEPNPRSLVTGLPGATLLLTPPQLFEVDQLVFAPPPSHWKTAAWVRAATPAATAAARTERRMADAERGATWKQFDCVDIFLNS